ncbi:GTP binding protein 6 [Turdus rufiventris]|nr:GTP binding protein 6 [Turdus rufiventris]
MGGGAPGNGAAGGGGDEEGEEEDEAALEELLGPSPLAPGPGAQRVAIVHPAVKWGPQKSPLTTAELQIAEAVALVDTLQNWTVLDKTILPTKNRNKKFVFGKGNFQVLTGETFLETQNRVLKERELKIRNALEKLRRKRALLRTQRKKFEFPIISVMGYTNCGKTTLIKALTGEAGLQPRDQLFATLDITAHAGYLPSHMAVIYVDTIGFLTDLPHNLVESFSATLEEVAYSNMQLGRDFRRGLFGVYVSISMILKLDKADFSDKISEQCIQDLIVHVRDITHPETVLQKATVLSVLRNLNLPSHLLDSMVEVHNKVDLIERYKPAEENALAVSALHGHGLEELKQEIEKKILAATGKKILTVNINLEGPQLSWLYKEATVQEVEVMPEEGTARVKVIISSSAFGKYKNLFPNSKIFMS